MRWYIASAAHAIAGLTSKAQRLLIGAFLAIQRPETSTQGVDRAAAGEQAAGALRTADGVLGPRSERAADDGCARQGRLLCCADAVENVHAA